MEDENGIAHDELIRHFEAVIIRSIEHMDSINNLLQQSEGRIDRTNEMIVRLANHSEDTSKLFDEIRKEYKRHIDLLVRNRNKLLEQLYTAQKMVIDKDNIIKEKDEIIREKDATIKELFLMGISSNTTNFNVHK